MTSAREAKATRRCTIGIIGIDIKEKRRFLLCTKEDYVSASLQRACAIHADIIEYHVNGRYVKEQCLNKFPLNDTEMLQIK